jgi:hypothetical protein
MGLTLERLHAGASLLLYTIRLDAVEGREGKGSTNNANSLRDATQAQEPRASTLRKSTPQLGIGVRSDSALQPRHTKLVCVKPEPRPATSMARAVRALIPRRIPSRRKRRRDLALPPPHLRGGGRCTLWQVERGAGSLVRLRGGRSAAGRAPVWEHARERAVHTPLRQRRVAPVRQHVVGRAGRGGCRGRHRRADGGGHVAGERDRLDALSAEPFPPGVCCQCCCKGRGTSFRVALRRQARVDFGNVRSLHALRGRLRTTTFKTLRKGVVKLLLRRFSENKMSRERF